MVLSGEDAALSTMHEACKTGPRLARVDKIDASTWSEKVAPGFTLLETV